MSEKRYYDLMYHSARVLFRLGGNHRRLIENHWRVWDNNEHEKWYYNHHCAKYSKPHYNPYEIFPEERKRFAKSAFDTTINQQDIDRAKAVHVESILKDYNVEIRRGRAKCPIHNGEGFNFSFRGNKFKCHTCGESGDSIQLVRILEKLDFKGAVKRLI
jgi:hypothetical protein